MTTRRVLYVIIALMVSLSVFARPRARHADPAGAQESPAVQHAASDTDAWPSVSQHQERHPIAARPNACGGEPCENDPGPGGAGGSALYGLCKSNMVCSLVEYGMCYSKTFGKCQDKTSGEGNACRAC